MTGRESGARPDVPQPGRCGENSAGRFQGMFRTTARAPSGADSEQESRPTLCFPGLFAETDDGRPRRSDEDYYPSMPSFVQHRMAFFSDYKGLEPSGAKKA